jgi:hypothetical protein
MNHQVRRSIRRFAVILSRGGPAPRLHGPLSAAVLTVGSVRIVRTATCLAVG